MTDYGRDELSGKTPRMLQGKHTGRAAVGSLKQKLLNRELFHGQTWNYRKRRAVPDELVLLSHLWRPAQTDRLSCSPCGRAVRNFLSHIGRDLIASQLYHGAVCPKVFSKL
jgi:hypothetical protein